MFTALDSSKTYKTVYVSDGTSKGTKKLVDEDGNTLQLYLN
jgi:hypothetical protein